MKILNISYILPMEGREKENRIVLDLQDYLTDRYSHSYKNIKLLPYTNNFLSTKNKKWAIYYKYLKKRMINLDGYTTTILPWFSPPTSNYVVSYLMLPFNWILFHCRLYSKLRPTIKDCDLIITQTLFPDAIVGFWIHKKTGLPYIMNLRGPIPKYFIHLPFIRSVFNKASKVITASPTNYDKFKNKMKIDFLPHPVDDIFFKDLKKTYNYPSLISVCRLIKLKNLDYVIHALFELKNKGYKFDYTIIGDGEELPKLKKLVTQMGLDKEIIFKGWIDNKNETIKLLSKSHIFVMPSFPETLGRSFLEAAALKCLCIGHEKTGVDGLFTNNESALFVNKKSLAPTLENIFSSFSEKKLSIFTDNAYKIVEKINWKSIGKKYSSTYKKTIKHV